MIYLFSFLLFSYIAYAIKSAPGAALMYVLLYQTFNKLVFEELGLDPLRHLFVLGILGSIVVIHYRKTPFKSNIDTFIRSRIIKAYILLFAVIIGYAFYFGTEYEFDYIVQFINPNMILMVFAALLFFNMKMFNQAVIGMIVFSVFTLVSINLFKDFASIGFVDRSEINAISGIGPLTQGKMAGIMALASILFFFENKSKRRWMYVLPVLISGYWMISVGSRGAVLFLFITLATYLFFSTSTVRSVFQIIAFALVITPIIFFADLGTSPLAERSAELLEDGGLESTARYYRIFLFFQLLPDNFLIGLGPGGWGKEVMLGDYRYPHNIIIESWIEFGLFGVFYLITLIGTSIAIIRESMMSKGYDSVGMRILAMCWVYYAFNTLTSGSLLNNSEFHIFNGILIAIQSKLIMQRNLMNIR
jgi:hypothetical protein